MDRLAVKHRLLDKGMTLAQLASVTGVPYDRLVKIVNGYREPRPEEVQRIASVLSITPDELMMPEQTNPSLSLGR